MQEQIEFLELMVASKNRLRQLEAERKEINDRIDKMKRDYQRKTNKTDFNLLLIDYLKSGPDWLIEYYGNLLIDIKPRKIIFQLNAEYIDDSTINVGIEYKDPYYLGYFLSDNFAGRSKYWYSEPYQSKKYKLSKWEVYNVFNKIKIDLH